MNERHRRQRTSEDTNWAGRSCARPPLLTLKLGSVSRVAARLRPNLSSSDQGYKDAAAALHEFVHHYNARVDRALGHAAPSRPLPHRAQTEPHELADLFAETSAEERGPLAQSWGDCSTDQREPGSFQAGCASTRLTERRASRRVGRWTSRCPRTTGRKAHATARAHGGRQRAPKITRPNASVTPARGT